MFRSCLSGYGLNQHSECELQQAKRLAPRKHLEDSNALADMSTGQMHDCALLTW
ncbi:hypothetical protein [Thalassotalea piscium]|uniref:hypothetical protein n=1 Tax=Thalassotalea piscium TaxID=1230533 RepID=UPI0016118F25|nr:hypothetical protein [Thalassotalea piscium]